MTEKNYDKNAWLKKKQEEKDRIYKMADEATTEIISDRNAFKEFLKIQSRMDRYSAVNCMLIMKQRADAIKLREFDEWSQDGISINPGEKGICVLEPVEYTSNDGTKKTSYNVKKVFDVTQTNSNEIAHLPPSRDPNKMIKTMRKVFEDTGSDNKKSFAEVAYDVAVRKIPHSRFTEFECRCISYMLCLKYGIGYNSDLPDIPDEMIKLSGKDIRLELSTMRNTYSYIHNAVYSEITRNRTEEFE